MTADSGSGSGEVWVYDGKRFPTSGLSFVAGKSKEEFSPEPVPYSQMRPGCYDSAARLEDMDRAGIRAEQVVDKQRFWVARGARFMDYAGSDDVDTDTLNVRALFREHVYGCFIDDHHGIASIDEIGEDNIMCETDYPHTDSTWPNCIEVVKKQIGHLPAETQYKILRGNAERLYRFTAADPAALTHG
jgi:hypothetical protein